MSGHHSFDKLRAQIDADPKRRARVERYKREMDVIELAELRESLQVTQQLLAGELQVTQANVSRIERQEDLYLSTLAGYVTALGGRLKVEAVFPDRTVELSPFNGLRDKRRNGGRRRNEAKATNRPKKARPKPDSQAAR